jgi:hypothetical protein
MKKKKSMKEREKSMNKSGGESDPRLILQFNCFILNFVSLPISLFMFYSSRVGCGFVFYVLCVFLFFFVFVLFCFFFPFFLNLGVGDGALELEPVADEARVGHEALDVGSGEGSHALRVKAVERGSVVGPLAEYREPTQAGLRALEDEKLKELAVVVHGPAPLLVVVADVLGVSGAPAAAGASITKKKKNQ